MKTPSFLFSCLFIMFISLGTTKAQTVYITDSGKKYHSKNCSILKDGTKKAISLAEAKRLGYEACKPCKADEIVAVDDKKKPASGK